MQIVGKYLVKLHFSITLALDTIMEKCLSFKQHIPPLEYVVEPADLIDMPPDNPVYNITPTDYDYI